MLGLLLALLFFFSWLGWKQEKLLSHLVGWVAEEEFLGLFCGEG